MSVTYQITTIPNLADGETGYALSDGSYAAISFFPGIGAAPDTFSWKATARAVKADGTQVNDHNSQPLIVGKHASCPKQSLVDGTAKAADIKAAALENVINDPDGLVAELAAVNAWLS